MYCQHLMGCVPFRECAYVLMRVCVCVDGNNEKLSWKEKTNDNKYKNVSMRVCALDGRQAGRQASRLWSD